MTQNIKALDFNGVKVELDGNTSLIKLKAVNSASSYTTFHDQRDNSNYQVPTGKKATIIFIDSASMANASDKIVYADDLDGGTNEVVLVTSPVATLTDEVFISAEVPADKYINAFDTSTDTYIIWIIEEDA